MKDAEKHLLFWIITLFILIPSSTYVGYRFGYKNALKTKKIATSETRTKQPAIKEGKEIFHQNAPEEQKKSIRQEAKLQKEKKEAKSESEAEVEQKEYSISCEKAKENFLDFLAYLNHKKYVNKYCGDKDIKDVISEIVKKLSHTPPVLQGEGLNSEIMLRNIYFFFRTLSINEIKLIKEILQRESDQIEYVLRWGYIWLVNQDRCPDPYGLIPSLDIAYRYACFFLNTIGGRAYLLRRADPIRILLSYYSLLVIHRMAEKGKNIYGINISSMAKRLKQELKRYPELAFQKEYLDTLEKISH